MRYNAFCDTGCDQLSLALLTVTAAGDTAVFTAETESIITQTAVAESRYALRGRTEASEQGLEVGILVKTGYVVNRRG